MSNKQINKDFNEVERHTRVKLYKSGKHWVRVVMNQLGLFRVFRSAPKTDRLTLKPIDQEANLGQGSLSQLKWVLGLGGVMAGALAPRVTARVNDDLAMAYEKVYDGETLVGQDTVLVPYSESASLVDSESLSLSLSLQTSSSSSLSLEVSQNQSQEASQSASTSTSESVSLSASYSASASVSVSESASGSASQSASASLSASTSTSLSAPAIGSQTSTPQPSATTSSEVSAASSAVPGSASAIAERGVGLSYTVEYIDETGTRVHRTPHATVIPSGDRITVMEAAQLPKGYALAEGQEASITQELIKGQTNIITFKVVQVGDTKWNEESSFRAVTIINNPGVRARFAVIWANQEIQNSPFIEFSDPDREVGAALYHNQSRQRITPIVPGLQTRIVGTRAELYGTPNPEVNPITGFRNGTFQTTLRLYRTLPQSQGQAFGGNHLANTNPVQVYIIDINASGVTKPYNQTISEKEITDSIVIRSGEQEERHFGTVKKEVISPIPTYEEYKSNPLK